MLSAVVPWVSAEILMLSLPALTPAPGELATLVVIGTAGQMLGKCLLYWTARRASAIRTAGRTGRMIQWGARFMDRPRRATGLVLLSASLGLPPFFAITLLAGAMKMNFSTFVAVGTLGRFVHFSLIVWAGATGVRGW